MDLCDSLGSGGGSEDTESDADMRLGSQAQAGDADGSESTALPDPDGMYARATRGNLVEKSPGKCEDCAKKLDKNWFRSGSIDPPESFAGVSAPPVILLYQTVRSDRNSYRCDRALRGFCRGSCCRIWKHTSSFSAHPFLCLVIGSTTRDM